MNYNPSAAIELGERIGDSQPNETSEVAVAGEELGNTSLSYVATATGTRFSPRTGLIRKGWPNGDLHPWPSNQV